MSESSGMRTSPTNMVMGFFTVIVLWLLLSVAPGYLIAGEITLDNISQDEWFTNYLMATGGTIVLVYFLVVVWFSYGSKTEVLEKMNEATTKYRTLFMLSIILGVVGSLALIILFLGEGNDLSFIVIDSALLITSCALGFWLSTFLFSPKYVEYIPFGK